MLSLAACPCRGRISRIVAQWSIVTVSRQLFLVFAIITRIVAKQYREKNVITRYTDGALFNLDEVFVKSAFLNARNLKS